MEAQKNTKNAGNIPDQITNCHLKGKLKGKGNDLYAQREHKNFEYEPQEMIKQNSSYVKSGKCAPDNNPFWTDGQNPLSSKGN